MTDFVVLGGALIASANAPMQPDCGVWVEDGRIGEVGRNDQLRTEHAHADVVDARDLLLMPGLVNAHMHAYGLLAHGLRPGTPISGFSEFLTDFWWPNVEDRLDLPMIQAAMRLACCHMIRSGVTTFCDVLEAPNAPDGILEFEAEIVRDIGLRAVLMTEASERISKACGERLLREDERFIQAHREDDLIRGMLCLHTSFTCSKTFVERARRMMDDLECRLHLHLSESAYEPELCCARFGQRPVPWYDEAGIWGPRTVASQVVAVDDAELRVLAERGVHVVHMPLSNCEVGGGIAPVPQMIDRGLRPGLGSDGYINNLFEVMRGAFLIHKGFRQAPDVMPSDEVFRMATAWDARAIGFDTCGEIAPGSAADLIGLDLAFDTPLTPGNALDQIILCRNPEHVKLSIVGGRRLMERGELLSCDEARARSEALAQAKRLWREV